MKTSKTIDGNTNARPVLAASVGLGDTTLDTIINDGSRPLRIGAGVACDLPFTCKDMSLATRRDGAWTVRLPDGVEVDGAAVAADGTITLFDWDGAVTLTDGDAWLRLWPTRGERYVGPGMAGLAARSMGRALPVLWLAFALIVGMSTFAWWAGTAFAGNPYATGDGFGNGMGLGDASDRVASFGEGEFAAGTFSSSWVSIEEPDQDATAEEEVVEQEVVEQEETVEEVVETEDVEDATAEDEETVDEQVEQVEEVVEQVVEQPALDPELATDAVAEVEDTDSRSRKSSRHGATASAAGAAGGGGSFGLGGGTDDGFADRGESLQALERKLLHCISGDDAYRVTLSVNSDGSPDLRSVDYDRGSWSSAERTCVGSTIEEWAFPRGDEDYEVSLRLRKSSRGGRA